MLADAPVAVVLPSSDLDRSKEYYQNKLGLKLRDGTGPLVFEAGKGTFLQVYLRPGVKSEHTQAEFRVDDIDNLIKELEAKGVAFEDYEGAVNHVIKSEQYKMAWIKDPDGNFIALNEFIG